MVAIAEKVYVYDFSSFSLIASHETVPNQGIVALTPAPHAPVYVAALDKTPGHVWLGAFLEENTLAENRVIEAHNSSVAAIALNQESSLLATCSEKGTILRVFKVADGLKLKELRRGSEYAEIRSLAFALDSAQLACSSAKGTVHVFALPAGEGSATPLLNSSSAGASIEEEKKSAHEGQSEHKA